MSGLPRLEEGLAFGAIGLAVVETASIYQKNAPTLKDVRAAPAGDAVTRQLILDADMFGLIVVLALGGGGAVLIRRWYPLLLAAMTLLLLSGFYRSVCNSPDGGVFRHGHGRQGAADG